MDKKEFSTIYKKVISLWPNSIDVRNKTLFDHGGATIPNLIDIHDEIEQKLETLPEYNDFIHGHVDWAIYQLLHRIAKNSDMIYPQKIDIDEVFKLFNENEASIKDWKI